MILPHQQPQNTTKSQKNANHKGSLAHLDRPTNRCTCTSDRSGPAYLPSHHPDLPPARSLQHPTSEAPPSESSRAIRHLEAIFESCNTSTYAALKTSECLQEGGRKWKEVSTLELGIWFGIVVYMGVHNSPAVRDYWRHDGLNPAYPISEHMGQTLFEEIKRYFHVLEYLHLINQRKHC